MTVKLTPTPEEIESLSQRIGSGPVTIVNLLKFRDGEAGRAAYRRYMTASRPASSPRVEILYAGRAIADVGGGEDWDYIIIARYPDFADFAGTVTHPAYQVDAAAHRPEALEKTVMIVSREGPLEEL